MKRWLSVLRTPLGLTASVLTAGVLVLAVVAPILWTDEANAVDTGNILAGPSSEHWAGTDNLGRDIFYRVLVATRLTVRLALSATAIAVVVGLLLGTASFLLGRRPGRVVNAGINIAVAFPGLLLALFFAVIFGVGATGAVLAIGLAGAPAFARLTQTLVASVASRDYVAAAQVEFVAGAARPRRCSHLTAEVLDANHVVTQDERAPHLVLELAHVAGPREGRQRFERRALHGDFAPRSVQLQEMLNQETHVAEAFA